MPDKNGTGPKGSGPMTGRGSGKCILPLKTREEELAFLKNQEAVLAQELMKIRARIDILTQSVEKEN